MSKRPKSLVMGAGERPPNVAVAVLTLQHAALALVFLVYAVLIGKGAGFTSAQQQALVNGTLLACGLGAVLHARGMPWGSGLLAIPIAGPVFMPVAIQAGVAGGPAGVAAVVLLGGLIQWLTGGLMRRIRVLFPPEVCGVVVMMLGVSLLPGALRRAVGIVPGAPVGAIQLDAMWISLFTLAAMVAVSIWLRGGARFFAMLLGCAAGLLATLASRGLSDVALAVGRAEWLAMPELAWPGLSLDAALIPVVLLLAVVSAIDGMGVLIGTDRLDDAQWFRPNLPQLAAGIRAVGTTNVASALLGGCGTVTALAAPAEQAGLLACPRCGAGVSPSASACAYCTAELLLKACPRCLSRVFHGHKHCPECGSAIDRAAAGEVRGDLAELRSVLATFTSDEQIGEDNAASARTLAVLRVYSTQGGAESWQTVLAATSDLFIQLRLELQHLAALVGYLPEEMRSAAYVEAATDPIWRHRVSVFRSH